MRLYPSTFCLRKNANASLRYACGRLASRMMADTDSIFCACAFLDRSVFFAMTSDMVEMMAENTKPPTIMPKHAMTRSLRVTVP